MPANVHVLLLGASNLPVPIQAARPKGSPYRTTSMNYENLNSPLVHGFSCNHILIILLWLLVRAYYANKNPIRCLVRDDGQQPSSAPGAPAFHQSRRDHGQLVV